MTRPPVSRLHCPRWLSQLGSAQLLMLGLASSALAQAESQPNHVTADMAPAEETQMPAAPSAAAVAQVGDALLKEDAPARAGSVDGQLRMYLMSTVNAGDARDWFQTAVGGHLGYRSPALYGFSLGARAYVAGGPVGNSQRTDRDTGVASRYEAGLFDFTDRDNKEVVVLGEAFVGFDHGGHHAWLGRHRLKTPMLNPQDGRMIPSLFQGAWYRNQSIAGLTLDVGYLSHVYARSGPSWRRIEDTFGIYPQGRTVDAAPASYSGNTAAAGILAFGVGYEHSLFSVKAWDYAFENIFNVIYADAFVSPRFGDLSLSLGVQYVGGQRLGNGGSDEPEERYFDRGTYHVMGARAEMQAASGFGLSVNYNRVTAHGPFLFPRELGVEPLFVFLKRERTEGSGDVHAGSVQLEKTWRLGGGLDKIKSTLAYGHYYRTDPRAAELNKYGFPSLYQLNWDTFVHFGGSLEGFIAELLVVYKGPLAETHDNPRFEINKVNMLHVDLVLNYAF